MYQAILIAALEGELLLFVFVDDQAEVQRG